MVRCRNYGCEELSKDRIIKGKQVINANNVSVLLEKMINDINIV